MHTEKPMKKRVFGPRYAHFAVPVAMPDEDVVRMICHSYGHKWRLLSSKTTEKHNTRHMLIDTLSKSPSKSIQLPESANTALSVV